MNTLAICMKARRCPCYAHHTVQCPTPTDQLENVCVTSKLSYEGGLIMHAYFH